MSSQSDIVPFKNYQSSGGSGKSEKKKKHAVSSLIRHPGSTPGTVLFAVRVLERIQHRRREPLFRW